MCVYETVKRERKRESVCACVCEGVKESLNKMKKEQVSLEILGGRRDSACDEQKRERADDAFPMSRE